MNMLQIAEEEDVQVMFAQAKTHVPENWVLLNSQSTVSVFRKKSLLSNIREGAKRLRLIMNGGEQISTLVGDLRNFGTVWYNQTSLANMLSMADVRKRCRITMDLEQEATILVHRPDGSIMKFVEFKSGLYYYDLKIIVTAHNCFTQNVEKNKNKFHHRKIEGADKAQTLHEKIGRPSERKFQHI